MSTSKFLFARHAKTVLGMTVFAAVMLAALVIEIFLRMFMPYSIATIGHVNAYNAALYGWGFSPFETTTIGDPDTRKSTYSRMNSHGWRDRVRSHENKDGAFRILVLGDSVTFGAIVPDDQIYTRILENNLQAKGFNAEVINISYGGWGTDQELEAMRAEGLLYKPDIIIVQFCSNDLSDNARTDELGNHKPFLYRLDAGGMLHRDLRNSVSPGNDAMLNKGSLIATAKKFLMATEITKRCYGLYLHINLVDQAVHERPQPLKYAPRPDDLKKFISTSDATEFFVSKSQLYQLQLALNLDNASVLLEFLRPFEGKNIDTADLDSAITASSLTADKKTIERILEKRWFNYYWSKKHFYNPRDASPYEWKLYFAIVLQMKQMAEQHGARFLLFDEGDRGAFQWERYWYRISPDLSLEDFLGHKKILKDFAQKSSIGFIPNSRVYQRARNDPHPNSIGNEAMAGDIEDYLLKHYGSELERYRKKPATAASQP